MAHRSSLRLIPRSEVIICTRCHARVRVSISFIKDVDGAVFTSRSGLCAHCQPDETFRPVDSIYRDEPGDITY